MNKHVSKPSRRFPLIVESDVSEEDMEHYFRENRTAVARKLRAAMQEMKEGKGAPLEPLEKFLADMRRRG
jgi:hypothetical protein